MRFMKQINFRGEMSQRPDAWTASATKGPFQVEVISDITALAELQPLWNGLLAEAEIMHPFVTYEWLITWWECFGDGKKLHVVLVKEAGKVRAILPLMISRESWYGLKVRRIGSLYNQYTPKFEYIVPPAIAAGVYNALWQHLRAIRDEWDVLEFCQLEGYGTAMSEVPKIAEVKRLHMEYWSPGDSPFVPTTGQWDEYLGTLGKCHRTNYRRRLRKLDKLGKLEMETIESGKGLENALSEGIRIEALAWKGSAGTAIASNPVIREFYMALAGRMASRGWLRLYFLVIDGRRIAFQYCLYYQNRLYLLKTGYDPAYAKYSPSHLLTWLILEDAFNSSIVEYDFLGVDDSWKLAWTRSKKPQAWMYIFRDSMYGGFLHSMKFRVAPNFKRVITMNHDSLQRAG